MNDPTHGAGAGDADVFEREPLERLARIVTVLEAEVPEGLGRDAGRLLGPDVDQAHLPRQVVVALQRARAEYRTYIGLVTADTARAAEYADQLAEGRDVDVLEIDGATHGKVDQARDLIASRLVDQSHLLGDLVNRGPQSLATLRRLRGLGDAATCLLGNHDLHLLAVACGNQRKQKPSDTLATILDAPDRDELLDWLRQRPLLHHDPELGYTMVHAGLPPQWDLATATLCAREVESALRGPGWRAFLDQMYGDQPDRVVALEVPAGGVPHRQRGVDGVNLRGGGAAAAQKRDARGRAERCCDKGIWRVHAIPGYVDHRVLHLRALNRLPG